MAKKSKAEAASSTEHWNDVLLKEFEGESDRACVILAASLLDSALMSLLQARFTPCPSNSDPLFDGANAPLSTFSSRIDATYRLGLLSARFCRDLHLVRRIRNDFTHNVTGCAFEESAVRDRVQALANSSRYATAKDTWSDLYPDTPKGQFQFAIGWMQWHIRSLTEDTECIDAAGDEWGYTNDWADETEKAQDSKVEA